MKSSTIAILSIALIAVIVAGYFALTYPRVILGISASFIGGTRQEREFNVPFLDSRVQVQVTLISGVTGWDAQILKEHEVIKEFSRPQGSQTTYFSDWIDLSPGNYNLTFTALGLFNVTAQINVLSKGGFW